MSIRWRAWEGSRSAVSACDGKKVAVWTIVAVGYVKGGPETESEVAGYLSAVADRARGEVSPEFPRDPAYMAGWIGKVTYERGIIDAVTGVPLAHPENAQYVAGYNYQPRPKGHGGGNRATPRTYSGPRF